MVRDKSETVIQQNMEVSKDDCIVLEDETKTDTPITQNVKSQLELYKDGLAYEEQEVSRRPALQDQQSFLQMCATLREIMAQIHQKKLESKNVAAEIEESRVKIMMLLLNIRKISRTQKVRVRIARENVLEARQDVDSVTLQLQGLLYEILHLEKESQRCLLAYTADKDIELLPVEQFYEQAPKSITRPETTLNDPHQQHLARLHYELEQRQSQTNLTDKLTQELTATQQNIALLKDKLAALGPRIEAILQTTVPLQEALDLPLSALKAQQEVAKLLPMALYTLWMQISAYGEVCDSLIKCIIKGDVEGALKLHKEGQESAAQKNTATFTACADNGNDSDNEPDNDDRQPRVNTNVEASATATATKDPVAQLYSMHPLYVELTVSDKVGNFVLIHFHWAVELSIVTVKCSVMTDSKHSVPASVTLVDVLNGQDFLDCIFPEDSGIFSPNPSTLYQMKQLPPPHCNSNALPQEVGRAYKWAQLLGGLCFPASSQKFIGEDVPMEASNAIDANNTVTNNEDKSVESVGITLNAIRRRLVSRLLLHSDLLAIQGLNYMSMIPASRTGSSKLFSGKINSEFVSWHPISWKDYSQLTCTTMLRSIGLATDRCLFFRAQYQQRHVVMFAYFCLSPDYPSTLPVVVLDLKWGEQQCPYDHIQQLESEINLYLNELIAEAGGNRNHILPLMLHRLATSFDIYVEACSSRIVSSQDAADPQYFQKEKIFFRPARGPDRSFPLKYLSKLHVFAHR